MLAPHAAESTEFIEIGRSAQFGFDQLEFLCGQSKLRGGLYGNFHRRYMGGEDSEAKLKKGMMPYAISVAIILTNFPHHSLCFSSSS